MSEVSEGSDGTSGGGKVGSRQRGWVRGRFPLPASLFPVFALAWRESRFVRRRLFLFLSAISLGVGALVAVQGFSANLAAGVREQARALLGADLLVTSRRPLDGRAAALVDSLRAEGAEVARVTGFVSMARATGSGGVRLVQVRAVEPGFPFYGTIETRPAGVWDRLGDERSVLVDPSLLIALDAAVGDTLAVGEGRFRILGALERVPGDVEAASAFAPRIYIPQRFVEETALVELGSRVDHEAFVRLARPADAEVIATAYRAELRREQAGVRTAEGQQQTLTETLGRLTSYLGLVGVFALLLGGIGVASSMRAFIAQKAQSVAVLRCLGATSGQVLGIYMLQAAAMGLVGAVVGVVLGIAAQFVLPQLVAGLLPVEVRVAVDVRSVLTGLGVGVWVAAVFALLPLLATRRISPLGAIRRQVEPLPVRGVDPARWLGWAAMAGSVVLLAVLQVGSVRIGLAFAAGVAAALLVLAAAARGAVYLLRRLRPGGGAYPVRQGLANLHRPGNQTATVVLALGFGVFLLATLYLAQDNLLRPLQQSESRANLLLFDVQEDQQGPAATVLEDAGHSVVQRAPIVPMRIAALNGERVRAARGGEGEWVPGEGAPAGWAVRREYRSTYRDTVVASEQVVEGRWWAAGGAPTTPEVSLERGLAEELDVGIGDRITWDVQGVEITTVVTSLREVDWARFEPNFFAVFDPDALLGAPQTWVLLARVAEPLERARMQRVLVERFANVAILDLTQLQSALDDVLGRVATAIRFLAGFSILTGFVVLLGAVATGRLQRVRESVLLKTLGATRGQIGSILLTEYLALGVLASLVGAGAALVAGWALSRWLFRVAFAVPAFDLGLLALVVTLIAGAVGVWGGREVFRRTPMEAIRED
jgi:putative ABC transport system permease protein